MTVELNARQCPTDRTGDGNPNQSVGAKRSATSAAETPSHGEAVPGSQKAISWARSAEGHASVRSKAAPPQLQLLNRTSPNWGDTISKTRFELVSYLEGTLGLQGAFRDQRLPLLQSIHQQNRFGVRLSASAHSLRSRQPDYQGSAPIEALRDLAQPGEMFTAEATAQRAPYQNRVLQAVIEAALQVGLNHGISAANKADAAMEPSQVELRTFDADVSALEALARQEFAVSGDLAKLPRARNGLATQFRQILAANGSGDSMSRIIRAAAEVGRSLAS